MKQRVMRRAGSGVLVLLAGSLAGAGVAQEGAPRVRRSVEAGELKAEDVPRTLTVVGDAEEVSLMLSVHFEFDSAELTVLARRDLAELALGLNGPDMAQVSVTVEGHTDAVGKASYNQRLSQRRAVAVVAYLVRQGVASWRLRPVGHGEDRLLAGYAPEDGRQRRVEFVRRF